MAVFCSHILNLDVPDDPVAADAILPHRAFTCASDTALYDPLPAPAPKPTRGAVSHPLHGHLPERLRVLADSLSHLQLLSLPSVANQRVSFLGVSPPTPTPTRE